ncbi:MAG TPA: hypothetical protein VKU83_07960 [Puia sp.]|nr:hypothetical protein [Puia sp.]
MYGSSGNSYLVSETDMNSAPSLHAVLTADIVHFTRLGDEAADALLQSLQRELLPYQVEFYRGDSFQAYMEKPEGSLRLALLCRALAISLPAVEHGITGSDIRISIGLGPVIQPVQAPGIAKGDAFIRSGRGLDAIQGTDRRIAIISGHAIADIGLEAMANHLDDIYRHMTAKQAAAIVWLLRGVTQQEATAQLSKSKSTVSQLVNAGNWGQIEEILKLFQSLIKQLS